jgi:hypothetical protein
MRDCAATLQPEMTSEEHALLLSVLNHPVRSGQHLEIGTAAGGTLCAMLQAFRATERPRFVVVDPMTYFPHQLDAVVRNLREHQLDPYSIDFRVATSREAFREAWVRQETFDFILVDGCHKILSVIEDLKWLRLLNVGGAVCFHDYTPKHRGVWLAVNRLLDGWNNYERIDQAGTLLALRKTAPSVRPEVTAIDRWYARAWYVPLQIERKWRKYRRAA